jgi:hypothetical protein
LKSLLLLWKEVAHELATRCCTSATMDWKTVQVRSEHEGISFLTISLASFGKDFQKSLDLGYVDRRSFKAFKKARGTCLPAFLQGFMDRVFDRSSGVLLEDPCIDAIQGIRQLTLMNSKVLLKCSDAREMAAVREYYECEQEVRKSDAQMETSDIEDFKRVSAILFQKVFTSMDRQIHDGEVIPKHGPGATADRFRGNGKYRQDSWTERLDRVFPVSDYLIPSPSYYDELEAIRLLEPGSEMPVRVITVPKTLKTPRVIAVEPTAMQYAQQGVLEVMLRNLSRGYLGEMLGFDDQIPNQEMAREGSREGTLATLDLSEASDRVSNQLVRLMLLNHPHLHGAVDACRSRKADVPGVGVIRLAKFASMGSALTFPVEAMVFLTLVFIGIERELRTPLTYQIIQDQVGKVRIYGDDIIVPVEMVHSVVRVLEAFGSRVNTDKSFWTGKFRESCGREFFDGHDVSVVKVRRVLPTQPKHAQGVISTISLRNQLYLAGYWQVCKWLDDYIRSVIRHFPTVDFDSPVLGRVSLLGYETQKTHATLHTPLVKGYVVRAKPPPDPLEGYGALLKFFLKRGGLPSVNEEHLERAGRPQAVDIKLRWARPF